MATDTISIDSLGLSAIVGLDCWGRRRAQPVVISVYLHLAPDGFLSRAGKSDSINDTIDYGSLTKAVAHYVEEKENGFVDVGQLIDGVVERAFEAAGENGKEVRVVVELPKLVPLAGGGMVLEVNATRGAQNAAQKKVYVKDLILSVIIGVNEPERNEKQRVVVNMEVSEQENVTLDNYQNIVRHISDGADDMNYFTLERMALKIASNAHGVLGGRMEKITVRVQKPSALNFARYSGVEITRKGTDF